MSPVFHMITGAPEPVAPFSHTVEADGWLFVTEQMPFVGTALDSTYPDGNEAQTRQVLKILQTVLEGCGLRLQHAVSVRVYLTHFDEDYAAMKCRVRQPLCGHHREPRMNALRGLAILLLLQSTGEALTHALRLPFPGPVVGLVLLLVALHWPWLREPVSAAAEFLLAHLSLLFVPVGVGVITHLDLVSHYGLQLLVVMVLSTWLGLAVTALVLRRTLRDDTTRVEP